jgi:hypothetical protein
MTLFLNIVNTSGDIVRPIRRRSIGPHLRRGRDLIGCTTAVRRRGVRRLFSYVNLLGFLLQLLVVSRC